MAINMQCLSGRKRTKVDNMQKESYFSSMNNSTAFSLAALRTPVMVPPARPAA